MLLINATNVNDAYVKGLNLLAAVGVQRPTRNGGALVAPESVTTHYNRPDQRVLFDAQRDANPFFHLAEALWMLAGANDVDFLAHYVPRMRTFSDDGVTLNAAYGFRWREHFGVKEVSESDTGRRYTWQSLDQLDLIVQALRSNPDDRRVVLQMWDPADLGSASKDVACNLSAKFELNFGHTALNMTVFNRSNDIIMGCYGANVVHFSILQEYLAARIGVSTGWYEQVSTNFHAYNTDWTRFYPLVDPWPVDEYLRSVETYPLVTVPEVFDRECVYVVQRLRQDKTLVENDVEFLHNGFFRGVVQPMSAAYHTHRTEGPTEALHVMEHALSTYGSIDWLVNGYGWLKRREARRSAKA